MGVAARLGTAVTAVGSLLFVALGGENIAWHQALIAGSCGIVALASPLRQARLVLAMGLAALLVGGPGWSLVLAGALCVVGFVGASASPPDADQKALGAVALLAVGLGVALGLKQHIAAGVLPAAADAVAAAGRLGLTVGLAAFVAATLPASPPVAEDPRGVSVYGGSRSGLRTRFAGLLRGHAPLSLALILVGCAMLGRIGRLSRLPPEARLAAAVPIDAVSWVIDEVIAHASRDPAALRAVLRVAPDADAAALFLGWEAALAEGWKPQRAEGVVVEVARALERSSRGGEALRLLRRHPRVGEVDALLTLFERTQSVPDGWRGGRLGRVLEGQQGALLDAPVLFTQNDSVSIEFTVIAEAFDATFELECSGVAFDGPPTLTVSVDAQPGWVIACPAVRRAQVWLAPGPHRLRVAYDNDRVGPGGDRNASVLSVRVEPFVRP